LDVHPGCGGLQPGAHSESGDGNSPGQRLRSSVSKRSEKADQGLQETKKCPLAPLPAGRNRLSAILPN
jgi:hypothetical protein